MSHQYRDVVFAVILLSFIYEYHVIFWYIRVFFNFYQKKFIRILMLYTQYTLSFCYIINNLKNITNNIYTLLALTKNYYRKIWFVINQIYMGGTTKYLWIIHFSFSHHAYRCLFSFSFTFTNIKVILLEIITCFTSHFVAHKRKKEKKKNLKDKIILIIYIK